MDQHEPQIHDVWSKRPTRLSPEPLLAITRDMPVRDAAAMLGINVGTLQKWRNGETQVRTAANMDEYHAMLRRYFGIEIDGQPAIKLCL